MARQPNVVNDSSEIFLEPDTCNVCRCDFSIDEEGGATGYLGIIPVTFCPTCHAGLYEMYTDWYDKDESDDIVLKPDEDQS